jgi:hypothetical protein
MCNQTPLFLHQTIRETAACTIGQTHPIKQLSKPIVWLFWSLACEIASLREFSNNKISKLHFPILYFHHIIILHEVYFFLSAEINLIN